MEYYFGIKYEFDSENVFSSIDKHLLKKEPGYICVADGNILSIVQKDNDYLNVVNGSMFSICDSSWVPLYLKWIYGIDRNQYCGSQIFMDIINKKKYRMFFLGTSKDILTSLKSQLAQIDARVFDMIFCDLPFCDVNDFNYPAIAEMINRDKADIIWVALGAPKQELFMNRLQPYLKSGVMIAVGAAFKFFSGVNEKRAPAWMINFHLEFLYRIILDPKKQLKRALLLLKALPNIYFKELKRKHRNETTY